MERLLMQPDCMDPLPAKVLPFDQAVRLAPIHSLNKPAIVFVSVVVAAILIFEIWAVLTGHHTISQWTQEAARHYWWVRWPGTIAGILLILHLFWKGPLW